MTQENTHYLDLDLGVVTAKKRRRFGRRFEEDSHGWIHTSVRPCDCLSSVDGTRAYRGDTYR